jgi:hypothetical protein
VPELSFHGAVTLLAMPTLTWNEDGVIAQQLFKYLWQRSVLTRNSLAPKHRERPLFVFSDEAQDTVSTYDGEFLSMCRGSRCSVTFMTQSLPNYYSKVGGDTPRETAEALVGKFVTNLFLSNGCPVTNEYASRVIGKELKRRKNYSKGTSEGFNTGMNMGSSVNRGTSSGSSSSSSNGGASSGSNYGSNEGSGSNWGSSRGRSTGETESHGYSESMEYVIEPGEFARSFKNGGAANNYEVTGVWFQSGRRFNETGKNILLARFDQGAK